MTKSRNKISVAALQTKGSRDMDGNLQNAIEAVERAARKGAKIICLPELYRTIYFPQYPKRDFRKFAEEIPGESTRAFAAIAKRYKAVVIVPVYEKSDGRYLNSAAVIDHTGKLLPVYEKIHIPHDPLFYEKHYFEGGKAGYRIYRTKYATFAVLICYDQWFPEAARMAALGGAEIIFYPTAIGYPVSGKPAGEDWHYAWETVMRGHAIANGIHVVGVNRVGREDKLVFWGQSFGCDSFGKLLGRASSKKEQVLYMKFDLGYNKEIRDSWGFFRNRRKDTYRL